MTKLDKILGRRYVPASTKVRIRKINRIGTGAVKIYKAIDKGTPPPLHEMIIYATLDSKEGEECLRPYITAGAHSRWAPVAASKNGARRTTPGSSGLSWRAAAQADMDCVGLHESRKQCYVNEHGIGQIAKWKRIAAELNDLPHLGHSRSTHRQDNYAAPIGSIPRRKCEKETESDRAGDYCSATGRNRRERQNRRRVQV